MILRQISLFSILYLFILSPSFVFLGVSGAILSFILVFILICFKRINVLFSREIMYVFLLFMIFGIYSVIVELLLYNGGVDNNSFTFFKIMFNNFVYFLFGYFFYFSFGTKIKLYDLLKIIIYIVFINALIIDISYLFSGIRIFFDSLLTISVTSNIDYSSGFRMRGIANSGGFSLSVISLIAIFSLAVLFYKRKIRTWTGILMFLTILVSQMFIARTGLYFSILILIIWLFFEYSSGRRKYEITMSICFFSLIIFFVSYFFDFELNDISKISSWAFELFENILKGKGMQTNSSNDLFSMFNIPSDIIRLIFGFGFFEADLPYRSDSGYVRTFYSIGVFAVPFYMMHAIILLYVLPKFNKEYKYYFLFLGVLLFILEIKAPVFYQNYSSRFIFLMYTFVFFEYLSNKRRQLSENYTYNS